jgi:dolichol-phosphate mannosyltransferase
MLEENQKIESKKLISIITPVFRTADFFDELVSELCKLSEQKNEYDFEFIFVNDGSPDNSSKQLADFAAKEKRARVIEFSRNFGHQIALTAGYDVAKGDAIITMDADLQDPPSLVPALLEKWEAGYNIVYARRKKRHESFFKKGTAYLYYKILDRVAESKMPRNVGDFRLIDKKVLRELNKCREKYRYLRGVVAWLGFKSTFVDFDRPNRKSGESGYTWKKLMQLAINGLTGFTDFPLQIAKYAGAFSLVAGFLGLAVMLALEAFEIKTFPTWAFLIVIIFIYNSFNFIVLWLIGEYIGRMYDQQKGRPLYIIDKKINIDE